MVLCWSRAYVYALLETRSRLRTLIGSSIKAFSNHYFKNEGEATQSIWKPMIWVYLKVKKSLSSVHLLNDYTFFFHAAFSTHIIIIITLKWCPLSPHIHVSISAIFTARASSLSLTIFVRFQDAFGGNLASKQASSSSMVRPTVSTPKKNQRKPATKSTDIHTK